MPATPDTHAIFTMALTVVALFLFSRDRILLETSALSVLVILVLVFEIFPYQRDGIELGPQEFFSGFGNSALVAICSLMIVGKGLEVTGALKPLADLMSQGWRNRPGLALLITLVVTAAASAFLNNTPIVVMMLPILVGVAIRSNRDASGMLMPMGLATIIGGMATTIGTSTNLIVVDLAEELGAEQMGLFYFTLPVLIAGSFGIAFLWLVAPRLLPKRQAMTDDFSPRHFNALLHITEDSTAAGKSLSDVLGRTDNRMAVTRIERGKGLFGEGLFITKLPSVTIQPGDKLYVTDTPENLKDFESTLKATLFNVTDGEHDDDAPIDEDHPLTAEGQQLAEVVVTRGSFLHHRTLNAVRFVERYKLLPLAIHRAKTQDVDSDGELGEIRLRSGDVLLVQGTADAIKELKEGGAMLVLDGKADLPTTTRAKRALIIMLLVVVAAASGFLPISISALIGAAAMLLSGVLTWRNTADSLSVPVIMIIVVSLALGHALMYTGGAEYIAQVFVAATKGLETPYVLSGLMFVMMILTNIVSNTAAAVIGTPVAISVAAGLGAPLEPFVLAVIFGANMSFATPMGYQTNLLVFGAGGYKFSDFLRVGIPLSLIMWLGFSIILPIFYDL